MTELARISFYYCPTRRHASSQLTTGARGEGSDGNPGGNTCDVTITPNRWALGPASDYAIVVVANHTGDSGAWWDRIWDTTTVDANNLSTKLANDYSPFRMADYSGPFNSDSDAACKAWKPRDTFSRWAGGTTNQLIIGEKYMYSSDLYTTKHDTTWLYSNDRVYVGTARGFHASWWPIARSGVRECMTQSNNTDKRFGSWHPGVCNFLVGDGSVRSISSNTSTADVLIPLGDTRNGSVGVP
jgi:hypothetical protein